jgi:hypothetical protein
MRSKHLRKPWARMPEVGEEGRLKHGGGARENGADRNFRTSPQGESGTPRLKPKV